MIKNEIDDPEDPDQRIAHPTFGLRRAMGRILIHHCMDQMKERPILRKIDTDHGDKVREPYRYRGNKPVKRTAGALDSSDQEGMPTSPLSKKSKKPQHSEPEDRTFILVDGSLDEEIPDSTATHTESVKDFLPKKWLDHFDMSLGFPQARLSMQKI